MGPRHYGTQSSRDGLEMIMETDSPPRIQAGSSSVNVGSMMNVITASFTGLDSYGPGRAFLLFSQISQLFDMFN
jgi:hypothetical protein